MFINAQSLLRKMLGDQATFRPGQWEAIEAVVAKKQHVDVEKGGTWAGATEALKAG